MAIRYIDQIKDLNDKLVFIRVDFNVPQDDKGNITDDSRIAGAVPTIRYAIEHGARVILASHLGRPNGEKIPKYTMAPASKRLSELLGKEVKQAPDCFGPEVKKMIVPLKRNEPLLWKTVRFSQGKKKNGVVSPGNWETGGEFY